MLNRLSIAALVGFLAVSLSGCTTIAASIANSAKARQQIEASYSDTIDIVRRSLKPAQVEFLSANIEKNIAQVKGRYVDGKIVRIFISRVSESETYIAVRVGTTMQGKEDAEKILRAISDRAYLMKQGMEAD